MLLAPPSSSRPEWSGLLDSPDKDSELCKTTLGTLPQTDEPLARWSDRCRCLKMGRLGIFLRRVPPTRPSQIGEFGANLWALRATEVNHERTQNVWRELRGSYDQGDCRDMRRSRPVKPWLELLFWNACLGNLLAYAHALASLVRIEATGVKSRGCRGLMPISGCSAGVGSYFQAHMR